MCFDLYLIGHYLPDVRNIRHKTAIHKMTLYWKLGSQHVALLNISNPFVSSISYITVKDSLVPFDITMNDISRYCIPRFCCRFTYLHPGRIGPTSLIGTLRAFNHPSSVTTGT